MKQRILFTFSEETADKPVITEMIRSFDLVFNIIKASINAESVGQMLVEIEGETTEFDALKAFIHDNHVVIQTIDSSILIDRDLCVECGACTAACMTGALVMDGDWHLMHHPEKCVGCGLCVANCPARVIKAVL